MSDEALKEIAGLFNRGLDNRPTAWMKQAACKDTDNPEQFWGTRGGKTYSGHGGGVLSEIGKVRTNYCNHCPVKAECAEYGRLEPPGGVWGGEQRRDPNRKLVTV